MILRIDYLPLYVALILLITRRIFIGQHQACLQLVLAIRRAIARRHGRYFRVAVSGGRPGRSPHRERAFIMRDE